MKLIVGLGNPGREYEKTRHNVGFMLLDLFAQRHHLEFTKSKMSGLYAEGYIGDEKVILLKPQKYMNLSGEVVVDIMKFYKIPVSDLLVISDDLDLPIGRYKLKQKGSCGGHNGLRNIELHLGTQEYKRLKIGISHDKNMDTADYVLGKFSVEDQKVLKEEFQFLLEVLDDYLQISFLELMSKYNHIP